MDGGLTLSGDMMLVLMLLGLTVFLFVFEIVRVDIAAICIMVLIGLFGLVPSDQLFGGFASNAVISIIAVMIIGAGLDRTGVMNRSPTPSSRWVGVRSRASCRWSPRPWDQFRFHAEHRRHRPVFARGQPHLGAPRPAPATPADADGILRDRRRHHHHGRLLTADPAQ
jgi:hypothetical protein